MGPRTRVTHINRREREKKKAKTSYVMHILLISRNNGGTLPRKKGVYWPLKQIPGIFVYIIIYFLESERRNGMREKKKEKKKVCLSSGTFDLKSVRTTPLRPRI